MRYYYVKKCYYFYSTHMTQKWINISEQIVYNMDAKDAFDFIK